LRARKSRQSYCINVDLKNLHEETDEEAAAFSQEALSFTLEGRAEAVERTGEGEEGDQEGAS